MNLNAVAFGFGKYVAVGDSGVVLTSPDTMTWSGQISGVGASLRGLALGNGLFVAVGSSGTIITSSDASTWTVRNSGRTDRLNAVAFDGTAFVVVGDSGTILRSTDAMTWQSLATGVSQNLNGVVGRGIFVIVGDQGVVLTSPDGLGWTLRSSGTLLGLNAVSRANDGPFVAVGNSGAATTSPDGVTWTVRYSGTLSDLFSLAVYRPEKPVNNLSYIFAAVGAGGTYLLSSDSGVNWTAQVSNTAKTLHSATFQCGGFVVAGDLGTIQAGFVWQQRESGVTSNLGSVVWADDLFVAAGVQGTLLTSSNGRDWVTRTSGTTQQLWVTHAKDRFLAFGGQTIVTSTNGLDWFPRTVVPAGTNLNGIAFGNGVFVAVGVFRNNAGPLAPPYLNSVLISTDGIAWTPTATINAAATALSGLAFGAGVFCTVGAQGAVFTSPDGVDWFGSNIGQPAGNISVTYLNDRFVVTSQAGALVTSTNGRDWAIHGSNLGYQEVGQWCFGDNAYVAIGHNSFLMTSTDGTNCVARSTYPVSGLPRSPSSVAFGAGTFVAVGGDGLVLQSVPALSTLGLSPGPQGINISLTGQPGRNLMLETVTNLVTGNWSSLVTLTNAPYNTNLIDKVIDAPQRYYRSREF